MSNLPGRQAGNPSVPRIPSYRRHRPTGQAVITHSGRGVHLGSWNTKASKAEYDRPIAEWLSCGRARRQGADLAGTQLFQPRRRGHREHRAALLSAPAGQDEITDLSFAGAGRL